MHTHGARARAQPSLFGSGVGLCGVTITQTALVLALQYVPAFNASLMQPSQPVLTLLLALCLRLEALRLRSVAGALKLAGILIGCAGAVQRARSADCAVPQLSTPPPTPAHWGWRCLGAPGSGPRYALELGRGIALGPMARMWCGRAARPKPPILRAACHSNSQEPHTRC